MEPSERDAAPSEPPFRAFYHVYPLGHCGAPAQNDFASEPVPRLDELHRWIPHMRSLGVDALYLGPVFESTAHGYDTADYGRVDRRLGTNETLARFGDALRQAGIALVLDAVFHHVGRDHWAFRDVQAHGEASAYRDWFHLRFDSASPAGDPFAYEGWQGHFDLVKLDLGNPDVRAHLFEAVRAWVQAFGVRGLRLDAADDLDPDFVRALTAFCRDLPEDIWLLGEVIHGDYRTWAGPDMLDSVTNYELYKGLWSSHVDRNYFELAWSLDRQFGQDGIYRDLSLYTFADNHDVDRVASRLADPAHLYPLHILLFTVPGIPSIYAGSEWGIEGRRSPESDATLRPRLELEPMRRNAPHPDLEVHVARFARIRRSSPALRRGIYRQLLVDHEQLAFLRESPEERIVVAVNAGSDAVTLQIPLEGFPDGVLVDLLEDGTRVPVRDAGARGVEIPPNWGRIMRFA